MRLSENRRVAYAVLAVCVLVSVFGLGGMGLARERNKVLTVYDRGSDTSLSTRHSVDAYLDSAAENAAVMASEARLKLTSSDRIDKVAQLAEQVASQADTNARYEAYSELKSAVDPLYEDMRLAGSNDTNSDFMVAYNRFWEFVNMIKYDDYSKLAASYNGLIDGFPGSVVAKLTGQSALNTFGG